MWSSIKPSELDRDLTAVLLTTQKGLISSSRRKLIRVPYVVQFKTIRTQHRSDSLVTFNSKGTDQLIIAHKHYLCSRCGIMPSYFGCLFHTLSSNIPSPSAHSISDGYLFLVMLWLLSCNLPSHYCSSLLIKYTPINPQPSYLGNFIRSHIFLQKSQGRDYICA